MLYCAYLHGPLFVVVILVVVLLVVGCVVVLIVVVVTVLTWSLHKLPWQQAPATDRFRPNTFIAIDVNLLHNYVT